ncbi:MAG: hypothetical protein FJY07_04840 [Bacteroidetes bacterium]|nr:hypothetical protein [Bacteroidota bacterium]
MKRNFKHLIIILFSIIGFYCSSQDTLEINYHRIDYCEEMEEICAFVKEFGSITNPVELSKHVVFPYFTIAHPWHVLNSKILPPVSADTNITFELSFDVIKEGLRQSGCNDPLHVYLHKASLDKEWKDSILLKHPSIENFFFSIEKNQIDYLSYLINRYNFPINFSIENIHYALKGEVNLNINNIEVPGFKIYGFGFGWIFIYKKDGEYKVRSVGKYLYE